MLWLYWEWLEGRPRIRPINPLDPGITLTQGTSSELHTVLRTPHDAATRILGVHLTQNGCFSKHLQVMTSKADKYAVSLWSPKLTVSDVRTFHRVIYTPAMKYSLPAIAINEEAFAPVQSKVLASILNGFSSAYSDSTWPSGDGRSRPARPTH